MTTRRELLSLLALPAVPGFASRLAGASAAQPQAKAPHTLPALPYAQDALEPHIDAMTMQIHHGRHHAGYVNNLNNALASHAEWAAHPVEHLVRQLGKLPESIRTAVRNNGGGHANHTLFWECMSPRGGGQPKNELGRAIEKFFGGFDGFREQFTKASLSVFGSGWAWLSLDAKGSLRIETTPNQDSPLTAGHKPLLGLDVWEHAYYLKYQNRRADYAAAFFNVIDWDRVAARFRG